jgi:hypothetical protein
MGNGMNGIAGNTISLHTRCLAWPSERVRQRQVHARAEQTERRRHRSARSPLRGTRNGLHECPLPGPAVRRLKDPNGREAAVATSARKVSFGSPFEKTRNGKIC